MSSATTRARALTSLWRLRHILQRPETVSWVLRRGGKLGAQHPLSPVIRLVIDHPRKKERGEKQKKRWPHKLDRQRSRTIL